MRTSKRSIQTLAAVVLVAVLTALVGSQVAFPDQKSHSTASSASLSGSWTVGITGGKGTPSLPDWYKAQVTFTRDGGLVSTITDADIQPGHGAWTRIGKRKFAITIFLFQFAPSGDFLGTLRARATLNVSRNGRTFDSDNYRFDFSDPDGHPAGLAGVGKAHGVRIKVQR